MVKVTNHCYDFGIKGLCQIYLESALRLVTQIPLVISDRNASCFVQLLPI